MLLSQLTPYPVLMPPPEITDAELAGIDYAQPRHDLERLLREKRAGPAFAQLKAIEADLHQKLKEHDEASRLSRVKGETSRWNGALQILAVQFDWLRKQVQVHPEEVHALVNRWLFLKFGNLPRPIEQIEGRRVVAGILEVTAGRRPSDGSRKSADVVAGS